MKRYLANLQNQPDHHKKRFALLSSATVTMFIFGFWSITTFGTPNVEVSREYDITPLSSLSASVAESFDDLQETFQELKTAFNKYGR